jgi:uncharacterized protein (DUF1800 family)
MRHKTIRPIVLVLLLLVPALTVLPARQKTSDEQQIRHVLNRLGFGARPNDIEAVRKIGLRQYIEQQLHPEDIKDPRADDRVAHLTSLRLTRDQVFEQYPEPGQLMSELGLRNPGENVTPADQQMARRKVEEYMMVNNLGRPQQLLQQLVTNRIVRGVYSERQLQEVMTDFWFNHFNIYWDKGADRWLTTDFEMKVIRPRAFGKFKDLLQATAQSPAMLFYLDNHLSSVPDPRVEKLRNRINRPAANRKTGINENYARELMELHTLGVDGGYNQKDVTEVARAFTGWTIDQPRQNANFVFRPQMHDRGDKLVLDHKISNGGMQDGLKVIEILARHPSTARFISTKLVRRFVSDNPPQSLIDKVAATYTKTDGDIREMLRTLFFSDEFMSPETYGDKMKTPLEYVVSSIRALDGDTAGDQQIARAMQQMGQPLYQYIAPTGFPDRTDQWMSDGALVARLNFAVSLTAGRLQDTRVSLNGFKDAQAAALFIGSPDFQKR